VARMGEGRGVHRVLVARPEGKRRLGRPRRRWEDNIKMDLGRQGSMGRTGFGGPVSGFCEHGNELSGSVNEAGYIVTS
jgi:hypothetical protein